MNEKKGLSGLFKSAVIGLAGGIAMCVAVHGLSAFFAASAILPFDAVLASSDALKDVMVNVFT